MMMAGPNRGKGKRVESEEDVFLTQFEEDAGKYDSLLSNRGHAASHRPARPRIPSVKEVEEKSEGPNWTMSSPAQNLAAALNDPANREYDLFTRTWGMYFVPNAALPPSNIPDIQLGDFLRYLKETAAVSINMLLYVIFSECICALGLNAVRPYMYIVVCV